MQLAKFDGAHCVFLGDEGRYHTQKQRKGNQSQACRNN
jgi:hypothetical protein